uniref:CUB domain-containing protein n=1 Tax=Poecilia latipinna TaxID=48699 RepID=A0A3B3TUW7_9TELE
MFRVLELYSAVQVFGSLYLMFFIFFLGDPGCGGTFTDSEGILISPNWPNNYAHNRQCIYLIRLPPDEQVALNFTNLELENHSDCSFDYVEVRDGRMETDPLIGKYCGSTLPAPIRSSSNSLWIRFKSDSSVSRAGFRAAYSVGEVLYITKRVVFCVVWILTITIET